MENVEDLQLRSLRKIRVFSADVTGKHKAQWLATSSKFGLVIACAPSNQLIVYRSSDIHPLVQNSADQSEVNLPNKRAINYYDSECDIQSLKTNHTGELLAVVVNKGSQGAFVHLYDLRIFSLERSDQPFPLVVLPVSKQENSVVTAFEWNPAEDVFAAASSDKSLLTVQFNMAENKKLTLLGLFESPQVVTSISWSPKGKQLVVGDVQGKIHQLKPDLSLVRSIDPPSVIPDLGNGPFRCVGLCWLSTTEWLVVHALHNSEQFNMAVLVIKKNQPPNWSFLNDVIYSNLSTPTNVNFYPIFDWSMVFVSSSNASEIPIIGNRSGSAWTYWNLEDNYTIQLPVSKTHGETKPLGISLDFSSVLSVKLTNDGLNSLPSQPMIYVLTTEGLLIPYHIASLNPQRPILTKPPITFSASDGVNGLTPLNFKSSIQLPSSSTVATPFQNQSAVSTTSMIQTNTTQSAASLIQRSNEKLKNMNIALFTDNRSVTNAANATPVSRPVSNFDQAQKKSIEESKSQRKDLKKMEYENAVAEYCQLRNVQAKRIDAIKEIRLKIDHNLAELNIDLNSLSDSIDELPEVIRELVLYKDDLTESLESLTEKTFSSMDRVHELKAIIEDIKQNKKSLIRDVLDFNNAKKMETLEERYLTILEKYEKMKNLLEKVKSQKMVVDSAISKTPEKRILQVLDEPPISPMDQRKINDATKKIAQMILKFSQRLNVLNKRIRELRASKKEFESKSADRTAVLNRSIQFDKSIDLLADECTSMLTRMTVVVEQPRFMPTFDEQESEKSRLARQAVLHKLLMQHSKEPVTVRKIEPINLLVNDEHSKIEPGPSEKAPPRDRTSTPNKQELSSRIQQAFTPPVKPKLVSIATQSPNWPERSEVTDGSFLRGIGKTQTSTPKIEKPSLFVPPKPLFSTTSMLESTSTENITSLFQQQKPSPLQSIIIGTPPTNVGDSKTPKPNLFEVKKEAITEKLVPATELQKPLFSFKPTTIQVAASTSLPASSSEKSPEKPSVPVVEPIHKPVITSEAPKESQPVTKLVESPPPTPVLASINAPPTPTITTTPSIQVDSSADQTQVAPSANVTSSKPNPSITFGPTPVATPKQEPSTMAPSIKPAEPAAPVTPAKDATAAPTTESPKPLFSFKPTPAPAPTSQPVATTPSVSFSFKPPSTAIASAAPTSMAPVSFSFKPPTATSKTSGFGALGGASSSVSRIETNDEGMEDDNTATNTTNAFGFLSTGTSGNAPATTKSAFSSGIFSQNKPATSGFSFAPPSFGGNSGFARTSQPVTPSASSGFGSFSSPTSQAKPTFGGGATFGGGTTSGFGAAPSFGGSAFGGGIAKPFAASTGSTFGGGSGFSSFANKSSAFGQLAQQSPPQQQQPSMFGGTGSGFGSFGGATHSTSNSLFGGGTSTPGFGSGSSQPTTQKGSAFTAWR